MAKIHEEVVVIKLSKLVKDSESDASSMVNDDILSALASVAEELFGNSVVVEVEKA